MLFVVYIVHDVKRERLAQELSSGIFFIIVMPYLFLFNIWTKY